MAKTKGKLAQDTKPDPIKYFQELIEKSGLNIRLSPVAFRQLEDGSLLLDQSKLLISWKIKDGKSE